MLNVKCDLICGSLMTGTFHCVRFGTILHNSLPYHPFPEGGHPMKTRTLLTIPVVGLLVLTGVFSMRLLPRQNVNYRPA